MRALWTVMALMALMALVAASALANPGGGSTPKEPKPASTLPTSTGNDPEASGPRQEAERSYGLAYEEIAKAKKDIEAGKAKNAEKKFKRALERVEHATALDAKYHEAWNLAGYCARKLGDYPKAFAMYEKCLAVKPDYAPAREYLGEAYLEQGALDKARGQLVLLERLYAESEADDLRAAIAAYEKAHPETKEPTATAPAAADTASQH